MVVFTSPTWAPSSHHSQNKLSSPQSGCISLEANHYNFSLWLRQKLPAFLRAALFLSVSLILGQSVLNFYCFAHFLQLRWSQSTQVVGAVTRCHNVIKVLRESSPCNKNSVPYNKGINFIALSTPSTNIYPRFVHWYSTAIIRSLKGYDIILKSSIWSAS